MGPCAFSAPTLRFATRLLKQLLFLVLHSLCFVLSPFTATMDVPHGDSTPASGQQLVGAAAEPDQTMSAADERTQVRPTFTPTASPLLGSHGYDQASSGLDTTSHDHCATDAVAQHREADTSEQAVPAAAQLHPSSPTTHQPAEQDPNKTGDGNAAENEKSDIELFEEYMRYPDTETDDTGLSHDHQGQDDHTKGGGVAISTLGGTRRLVRRTSTAGSIGGSGRSGDPYGGATLSYSSPRIPRLQANNDQEEGSEVDETEEEKLPPTIGSKRALKPFRTPATVRSASFDMAQKHDHEKRSYSSPPARASRSAPSWKTANTPITQPPSPSPVKVVNERDRQCGTTATHEHSESTPFAIHHDLPAASEARVQLKSTRADGKADVERPGSQERTHAQEMRRTSFPDDPFRKDTPVLEQTHSTNAPPRPSDEQRALDPPPTRHEPEVRFDTRPPSVAASRSEVRSRRTFIPQDLPGTTEDHIISNHPMIEDAPSKLLAAETGKRLQTRSRSLRHTHFPADRRDIEFSPTRPFGPQALSPVSERDTEFGSNEETILHTRGVIRTRTNDVPPGPRAPTKRVRGYDLTHVREDPSSMPPPVQEEYRSSSRTTTAGRREPQSQEAAVMQISDEEAEQEIPFDPQAPVSYP